jgi:mannose-6-phosphate isomerase-like protein (cupin superfamily)
MQFFTARIPGTEAPGAHPASRMRPGRLPGAALGATNSGNAQWVCSPDARRNGRLPYDGNNEESLVILHGRGEVRLEGQVSRPIAAPAFAYIPPAPRPNVANTGDGPLEYVYVVTPAQDKK